jgi:hypothetical protein
MDLLKKLGIFCGSIGLALNMSLVESAYSNDNFDLKNQKKINIEQIVNQNDIINQDINKKKEDEKNYKLLIGITRSYPKLKSANQEIKNAGKELSLISNQVKDFETWDDVYTGLFGIGIQKKFEFLGKNIWPAIYASYGSGSVNTSQKNISTIFGSNMDYDFKQTYTMYAIEGSLSVELFKYKKLTALLGGAMSYNYFESKTDFDMKIPLLHMEQNIYGKFKDNQIGLAVFVDFDYEINDKFDISAMARYDWLKFKGNTPLTEINKTPYGNIVNNTNQSTIVDVSGPSIGIFLKYKF